MLRRAVLALGAAGLVLSAWLAQGREGGWLLIGLGLLTLWAGWRHGRRGLAWGDLFVDAGGAAHWRDLHWRKPDSQAVGPAEGTLQAEDANPEPPLNRAPRVPPAGAVPVRVERWFAGERLAWLRLLDDKGKRYEILVGRVSIGDDRWRQLSAWLAWLRRGAA